ncbi:MAG: c-type cytochrome biogenesis protein CcmI [Pseudomonadota bacterium]|nr:c-type cytochrome biogenesis protein CcmI [Pseudomonadota bacterium]
MIGLIFLLMTLTTIAALMLPLMRRDEDAGAPRAAYDIAVYRHQLAELERDKDRGLLSQEQTDAARLEIQRRLLAAAAVTGDQPAIPHRWRALTAFLVAVILAGGSCLLYAQLGSPSLPDRPYASRRNDPDFRLNAAAEAIAAKLAADPDAESYKHLAGMFYALHRYDQAAAASQRAIDLGARDAATFAQLGESLVMANEGGVVAEAQAAFQNALAKDPGEPRARFYAGLAAAQAGQLREAVAMWRDLERDAPQAAPWLPMLEENIALYAKQGGFNPASVPPAKGSFTNANFNGVRSEAASSAVGPRKR